MEGRSEEKQSAEHWRREPKGWQDPVDRWCNGTLETWTPLLACHAYLSFLPHLSALTKTSHLQPRSRCSLMYRHYMCNLVTDTILTSWIDWNTILVYSSLVPCSGILLCALKLDQLLFFLNQLCFFNFIGEGNWQAVFSIQPILRSTCTFTCTSIRCWCSQIDSKMDSTKRR